VLGGRRSDEVGFNDFAMDIPWVGKGEVHEVLGLKTKWDGFPLTFRRLERFIAFLER
jgi:hypothetical protein